MNSINAMHLSTIFAGVLLSPETIEWWRNFFRWFVPEKPDLLYSALVAASAAMLSALLTNRYSLQRQKADFMNSASQKEAERLHGLRRELYLPFVDALTGAEDSIEALATCRTLDENWRIPLSDFERQLSKITIVAAPSVGVIASRFWTLVLETISEMSPHVLERTTVVMHQGFVGREFDNILSLHTTISQQIESGKLSDKETHFLLTEASALRAKLDDNNKELTRLQDRESELQGKAHQVRMKNSASITEAKNLCLIEVRREFG